MVDVEYGTSGIYKIVNVVNGKLYIGQSRDLRERTFDHFRKLRNNKHGNPYMQNSYNKHGHDSFQVEILELCDPELLNSREAHWINHYNSYIREYGYNIEKPSSEDDRIFLVSEQTKAILRENNQIYSDDDLLGELHRYFSEFKKVPTINDLEKAEGYPSPHTYKKRFGRYNLALEKSGLVKHVTDKKRFHRRKAYSKEEMELAVMEYVFVYQEYPHSTDFEKNPNLPSRAGVKRLYGSVENLMKEIGYKDYAPKKIVRTKEDVFAEMMNFEKEKGRLPLYSELGAKNNLPSSGTIAKFFGGLNGLKEEYEYRKKNGLLTI